MSKFIYLDTETLNEHPTLGDLPKVRQSVYAKNAQCLLLQYAVDDGEVVIVQRNDEKQLTIPEDVLNPEDTVVIFNASFDEKILGEAINITNKSKLSNVWDAARWATFLNAGESLAQVCRFYSVPASIAKLNTGVRLINKFCHKDFEVTSANIKDWTDFVEYAKHDILALRYVTKYLRAEYESLGVVNNRFEVMVQNLTDTINNSGMGVDNEIALQISQEINNRLSVYEAAEVNLRSPKQFSQMMKDRYNVTLPNCQQSTLAEYANIPEVQERLMLTSNVATVYDRFSAYPIAYDTLRYAMAVTGRWSSSGFQNLPRPKKEHTYELAKRFIEDEAWRKQLPTTEYMQLAQSSVRALIKPKNKNSKLIIADYNAIERRVMCYLAGDTKRLNEFKAYDKGTGYDTYIAAAAELFGISPDKVTSAERNVSKVLCLSIAYGKGTLSIIRDLKAPDAVISLEQFVEAAKGIKFSESTESRLAYYKEILTKQGRLSSVHELAGTEEFFENTAKMIYHFKEEHGILFGFRKSLFEAFKNTIKYRTPNSIGEIRFIPRDETINKKQLIIDMYLPSGRVLRLRDVKLVNIESKETATMEEIVTHKDCKRQAFSEGTLLNYVVQGYSRDLMAVGLQMLVDKGYDVVNTIHDEVVIEAPNDESTESIKDIMLGDSPYPWYNKTPKNVSVDSSDRYYKF